MKIYMEFRAATGGDEANDFAKELLQVYLKYSRKNNMKSEIINNGKTITILIEGKESMIEPLLTEDGIHKVQRVSRGKLHTSTVSIAVLPISNESKIEIKTEDIRYDTYRGSGSGGQHRNTTDSAVRLTHIPTGIVVCCENERSQYQNKQFTMEMLIGKLEVLTKQNQMKQHNKDRQKQVGTGDRAESRRTYNYIRSEIVDNISNKTCSLKEFIDKSNILALK